MKLWCCNIDISNLSQLMQSFKVAARLCAVVDFYNNRLLLCWRSSWKTSLCVCRYGNTRETVATENAIYSCWNIRVWFMPAACFYPLYFSKDNLSSWVILNLRRFVDLRKHLCMRGTTAASMRAYGSRLKSIVSVCNFELHILLPLDFSGTTIT